MPAYIKKGVVLWCLMPTLAVFQLYRGSPQVDMLLHSDTLFWFRANQSLLYLLNDACLAKKQQIPISKPLVWPDRGSNPRSTALEANTLTITPLMHRICLKWVGCEILLYIPSIIFVLDTCWRFQLSVQNNYLSNEFHFWPTIQQGLLRVDN